jgi:hypothetical protein
MAQHDNPFDQWAALAKDWRDRHRAMLAFPLFRNGWMQTDRLPEYEALSAAVKEARRRMDAFIAAHGRPTRGARP